MTTEVLICDDDYGQVLICACDIEEPLAGIGMKIQGKQIPQYLNKIVRI
jgi:hypothetical protein